MTKQEIIYKAIKKAMRNGWMPEELKGISKELITIEVTESRIHWRLRLNMDGVPLTSLMISSIYGIIFDHSFVEALTKDKRVIIDLKTGALGKIDMTQWKLHLIKMVLEKDPVNYLKKIS